MHEAEAGIVRMKHLAAYAATILNQAGTAQILEYTVEESRWQDQGFAVWQQITTYVFDDGAIIRRTVEQDDFPSDAVCAECWIRYEVLADPASQIHVTPRDKTFDNRCREAFWLKYHMA